MANPDEQLDNKVRVFTQYEAYMLAYGVAHYFNEDADFDQVTEYIDCAIPQILSTAPGI